jgi:hypothetical protein
MTMKNTVITLLPLLGLTGLIILAGGVNPHSVQAAGLIGNLPQANDDDATVSKLMRHLYPNLLVFWV